MILNLKKIKKLKIQLKMNKKFYIFLLAITSLLFNSCKDEYANLKDGLYAVIETNKGDIIVQLEYKKTPLTVANFVTLAEGKSPYVSEEFKGKPFYDGVSFHRVIPNFMIQSGDPLGNGAGDAGYTFKDEFCNLKHDSAGVLSMANSGPGTNSCQFFITHLATPWLDGKHTIFGHVISNEDIKNVNKIVQGDIINSVTIVRKGEAVKLFDAVKIINEYFKDEADNRKKQEAKELAEKKLYDEKFKATIEEKLAYFDEVKKKSTRTSTGFRYAILEKGNGEKPKKGQMIYMKYSGFLEDGTLFDTSEKDVAKQFGKYDEARAEQNGYTLLPYEMGSNKLIPGFIEGVNKLKIGDKVVFFIPSNLGYGEQGASNVIPPNANLIFEIQVVK
jgi:cyclophilin family peptidyl-prolyl cis-trans isomerase